MKPIVRWIAVLGCLFCSMLGAGEEQRFLGAGLTRIATDLGGQVDKQRLGAVLGGDGELDVSQTRVTLGTPNHR